MKSLGAMIKKLHVVLDYNHVTGIWIWKVDRCRGAIRAGDAAGCIKQDGYRRIGINGKSYRSARLAWLYMTGKWPVNQIDHINGIRDDDRFENLREATNRENLNNLGVHRNGNLPGASFNKRDRRWQAQIQVNGKKKLIGYFGTKEEAHKAYIAVKNSITQHFGDQP